MKTLFKIPRQKYVLACSGGPDSMAALAFLCNGKHDFEVAYFNHGTEHGKVAQDFIVEQCTKLGIPFSCGKITRDKDKRESPEEFFRKERYAFLTSFGKKIITAHHLDDCVETWIFSSINGKPKLISYNTDICLRPFLNASKKEMISFVEREGIPYIKDPSNENTNIPRNCIRHEILPLIKKVNPNIKSTIRKKLELEFKINGL